MHYEVFIVGVSCCGWSPRRNMHVRWRGLHAERTSLSMGNFVRVCGDTWGLSHAILFGLSRLLRYIVIHEPVALIEHVARVHMELGERKGLRLG